MAVRDTGIGIPIEKQGKVFDSFSQADATTTRHYGGTGLGLTISKNLVDMMGGQLEVKSEPGVGSVFHFTARFGLGQPKEKTVIGGSLQDVSVLVVDDNETNRMIFQEILFSWGINPTLVAGGPQALEVLCRAAADGRPIQVALIDAMMPEMDGFELAEKISADAQLLLDPSTDAFLRRGAHDLSPQPGSRNRAMSSQTSETIESARCDFPATWHRRGSGLHGPRSHLQKIIDTCQLRLLLAEDGLVNQKVAIRFLEQMGHHVELAVNGREAVDRWAQGSFDAILMDVQMPELDGFEATAEIRRREQGKSNRIPIIAMTAHAMKGDRERCLEAGMDDYLSKPIRIKQLEEALAGVTGVSRT